MAPCTHSLCVTVRRRARNLFRRTYWIACWNCSYLRGPFASKESAWARISIMNAGITTFWRNGDSADRVL